jgi:hypothetical protein
VAENVVSRVAGTWGVGIGASVAQTDASSLAGTFALGVEFRRNTVDVTSRGLKREVAPHLAEGFWNVVYDTEANAPSATRDADTAGVLGTIFEENRSINTPVGYQIGSGVYQTIVADPVARNVETLIRDTGLTPTSQGSQGTVQPGVSATPSPTLSTVTTGCPLGQFFTEYFGNRSLSGTPAYTRCEDRIDKSWGAEGPGPGDDDFSARWSGRVTLPAGTYAFTTLADDGVRVWVDGALLIDEWRRQDGQFHVDQVMAAGEHTIAVEYFEASGNARIRVTWERR